MRSWLFFPSVIGADRRAILQAKKKTIFQAKNRKKEEIKQKTEKLASSMKTHEPQAEQ